MIRFYCHHCGKSLRADNSIVGRKAQCTSCQKVTEVPPTSTRKSGEKKRSERVIQSVLADSDSFHDFEDVELAVSGGDEPSGKSFVFAEPVTAPKSKPAHHATNRSAGLGVPPFQHQTHPAVAESKSASTTVHDGDDYPNGFQPVFKAAPRRRKLLPLVMALAAILGCLLLVGLAVWLTPGGGSNANSKTPFEQTADFGAYQMAIVELKKSKHVLDLTNDGYLSAKGLTAADREPFTELMDRFQFISTAKFPLAEGNRLFDAGDAAAARKLIIEETKKVNDLAAEIRTKTLEIQQRTYNGN